MTFKPSREALSFAEVIGAEDVLEGVFPTGIAAVWHVNMETLVAGVSLRFEVGGENHDYSFMLADAIHLRDRISVAIVEAQTRAFGL